MIDPKFSWPNIIAAAMDSVMMESNPHPADPRFFIRTDQELALAVDAVAQSRSAFYSTLSTRQAPLNKLKSLLVSKVSCDGIVCSATGNI
jgi:hypothetical protein